ncbi:MAG: OmpA family protein [Gammaproteobacteria bacterium]|nr:OmpA family protein [Gammaproteobacteria bacterium]
MHSGKHAFVEKLIIITLPIALFAGCAGSGDIKTTSEQNAPTKTHQQDHLLTQNDLADISLAFTEQTTEQTNNMGLNDHVTAPKTEENNTHHVTATTDNVVLNTPYAPDNRANMILPTHNTLHFKTDDDTIDNAQRALIKQHAQYLIANSNVILTINGHTDDRGTEAYNQTLSHNRAQAVYNLLLSFNVPQTQLKTQAHGEHRPSQDQSHRAANRRVELEYTDAVLLSVIQ